jgi:hypothetical protein
MYARFFVFFMIKKNLRNIHFMLTEVRTVMDARTLKDTHGNLVTLPNH